MARRPELTSPASADPPVSPSPAPLALRPMARVARVTLFEREVRERLSGAAIEILLGQAQVLFEGRRAPVPGRGERFFGTALLTVRLEDCGHLVRESIDAGAARRVAAQMSDDERVHARVRAVAREELVRRLGALAAEPEIEIRVRWQGTEVYLDADIELPLEARAASGTGRAE